MNEFIDFISKLNALEVENIVSDAKKYERLFPQDSIGIGYSSSELRAMSFGAALALLERYHSWRQKQTE